MKSQMEHKFTSTGVKFWRHPEQMLNYKEGIGHSVISTHISPEGSCNLDCSYCSVKMRDSRKLRLELSVIQDYVMQLMERGLKAVILTGGGEPLLYPHINELLEWLHEKGLKIGLITNGTCSAKVKKLCWKYLSWVRVSLNLAHLDRVWLPVGHIPKSCVVGTSYICDTRPSFTDFEKIAVYALGIDAQYIRLLPNCLLEQDALSEEHKWLATTTTLLRDEVSPKFFHQDKNHRAPKCRICHQSFFRPYLSEVRYWKTGKPGSVYPCDSVVLNSHAEKFQEKYQLCAPEDVSSYLSGYILPRFSPEHDCSGCVFADTVEMLGDWKDGKIGEQVEYREPLNHEEFV